MAFLHSLSQSDQAVEDIIHQHVQSYKTLNISRIKHQSQYLTNNIRTVIFSLAAAKHWNVLPDTFTYAGTKEFVSRVCGLKFYLFWIFIT